MRNTLYTRSYYRTVDLIKSMAPLRLGTHNPSAFHGLQMPCDHRAVLRQVLGDGADIGTPLEHQLPENLHARRFAQGAEKFGVQNFDAGVGRLLTGCGGGHDLKYMCTQMHMFGPMRAMQNDRRMRRRCCSRPLL